MQAPRSTPGTGQDSRQPQGRVLLPCPWTSELPGAPGVQMQTASPRLPSWASSLRTADHRAPLTGNPGSQCLRQIPSRPFIQRPILRLLFLWRTQCSLPLDPISVKYLGGIFENMT